MLLLPAECDVAGHRNGQERQAMKIICQGIVKDSVWLEFGAMSKCICYHDLHQGIVGVDKFNSVEKIGNIIGSNDCDEIGAVNTIMMHEQTPVANSSKPQSAQWKRKNETSHTRQTTPTGGDEYGDVEYYLWFNCKSYTILYN